MVTTAVARPGGQAYCRGSARVRICLHLRRLRPFNGLFRQSAGVSLLRLSIAAPGCDGMLTVSSIACASRLRLRARLTLIRLALIRKPWSCGEGVSRPLCRYLCLHLLFRDLQPALGGDLRRARNAPLPMPRIPRHPTSSAPGFMPDYYPRATARPVSCYALFE